MMAWAIIGIGFVLLFAAVVIGTQEFLLRTASWLLDRIEAVVEWMASLGDRKQDQDGKEVEG